MTHRPLLVLALVATLAALATLPASAAMAAPGFAGDGAADTTGPTPLPPVTGPLPARRLPVDPAAARDSLPPDLATLLAQYGTLTRTSDGKTTLTPPSPELAALLEAEFDALK